MSDTPTTTETAEGTAPTDVPAQEPADVSTPVDTPEDSPAGDIEPEVDPETSDVGRLRGEAAKWRNRLRDTEAERDALRDQLGAAQRGHVEHLAAGRLSVPGDVWMDDTAVEALRNDDGHIDADLVAEHLDGLLERRPGLAKPGSLSHQPRPHLTPADDERPKVIALNPNDALTAGWDEVLNPRT